MREIDWSMMGPALGQVLFNMLVLSVVCTLIGMFVMKYFVRQVPLVSHAIIFFWAICRVLLVAVVVSLGGVIFDISSGPLSGLLALLGLCAVGWLITRHLAKSYGTSTKFPAVGAKVMASMLVLVWIVVGVVYLLTQSFA